MAYWWGRMFSGNYTRWIFISLCLQALIFAKKERIHRCPMKNTHVLKLHNGEHDQIRMRKHDVFKNRETYRFPLTNYWLQQVVVMYHVTKSREIHIGKIYSQGKSILDLHMQIEFIQNRFAKFNKFALLWWRDGKKQTAWRKKVVINSTRTFEMVHEIKSERAKNTFICQMDFRLNKVLKCCKPAGFFCLISERFWA